MLTLFNMTVFPGECYFLILIGKGLCEKGAVGCSLCPRNAWNGSDCKWDSQVFAVILRRTVLSILNSRLMRIISCLLISSPPVVVLYLSVHSSVPLRLPALGSPLDEEIWATASRLAIVIDTSVPWAPDVLWTLCISAALLSKNILFFEKDCKLMIWTSWSKGRF